MNRSLQVAWDAPDLDDLRDRLCRVDPETGCWLWQRCRSTTGYGRAWHRGAVRFVHRMILGAKLRRPVNGLALHRCGRGRDGCVNPEHLYEGSYADNLRDATRGGRHLTAKLTPEDVAAIRQMAAKSGRSQADIGAIFGVTQSTVSLIVRNVTWRTA